MFQQHNSYPAFTKENGTLEPLNRYVSQDSYECKTSNLETRIIFAWLLLLPSSHPCWNFPVISSPCIHFTEPLFRHKRGLFSNVIENASVWI